MDRYVGVDAHAESCTLGVLAGSGKRLKSMVVETNGRALVEAIRSIPGRVHVCLEEGTQSAWLYEILQPHAEEIVVTVPEENRGAKDDARDAWARADELRTGSLRTRVYKAPVHMTGLRNAARAYAMAVRDTVRVKNRLKAVFRSRGIRSDESVYEASKRARWLKQLPSGHREFAAWLGRELDALSPLREEAEERLLEEAKAHPIIKKLSTAPGLGADPDVAAGGDRGDAASVSDGAAVLELLRACDRDAVVVGLGEGEGRRLGAGRGSEDAGTDSEAAAGAEGRVQGSSHDGDRPVARASFARGLPADAGIGDQAEPCQDHFGASDCGDRVVDVEAPGGVRLGAPEGGDRQDVDVPADDASTARCGSGASHREGFEGEHPLVSWSPGRDGETPDAGYAPSEYPLKRWPKEAQSGAWCPRFAGGRQTGFEVDGVAGPRSHRAPRRRGPHPLRSRSRGSEHRPGSAIGGIGSRPLKAAAGARVEYCLDNSFLRS